MIRSINDEQHPADAGLGWKKKAVPFGAALIFLGSMAVFAASFNQGHQGAIPEQGYLRRLESDPDASAAIFSLEGTQAPPDEQPDTFAPSDEATVDPITPVPSDEATKEPTIPVPSDDEPIDPWTPISSDDIVIFDDYESDFGIDFYNLNGGDITAQKQSMFMWGAAKFVLGGLAKGALGKVGGDLTGWALGALGMDYGDQNELEEIKEQLKEQSKMLSDIQNTLDSIQDQLYSMLDEILNAIEIEGEKTRFEGWVQTLHTATQQLNGLSEAFYSLTFATPGRQLEDEIVNLR